MAAHSVTILIELAENLPFSDTRRTALTERYISALDYAPGMGELQSGDWNDLRDALENYPRIGYDEGDLRRLAIRVLGQQIARWETLGEPDSHENWLAAEHG